jgi:hypothetical protein
MSSTWAPRPGEERIELPAATDAGVHFIGRIRTPFATREDCPKNGRESTAEAVIEVDPRYAGGLLDIERCSHLIVLYWMDEARRDLVRQVPSHWRARARAALASAQSDRGFGGQAASRRQPPDRSSHRLPRSHQLIDMRIIRQRSQARRPEPVRGFS